MDKAPKTEPVSPNEKQKEKKKFTATVVDITDLMKSQSIDVGNEKMTMEVESEELQKLGGWKNLGKRMAKAEFWSRKGQGIWKYGLKRNYNLNKEIYKASQEILKTENVFAGEGKGKDAHDKVMADIIDQFNSGYEETIHEEAGEKKVMLGKDELEEEATGDKAATKQLIMDWATGKIDKESFKAQEERLFRKLKGNQDDTEVSSKENVMYASNLFQVAEQVKLAIENKEFLENEDFEFDVIYGKSKAGVRTEEHFNKTERIMNKLLTSKVGQFANETTIAIALSCVAAFAVKSIASMPGKIVPILGTALISSGFAKKREEMEQIRKRTDAFRKNAQGKFGDLTKMPVRAEILSTNYKTESAGDLLKNIDENLKILETDGKNLTEQEVNSILTELTSLEALIQLSDRRRIDLITYSDSTKVVEERKNLDIKGRLIKDALRKVFENGQHKIPEGQDFETYFNSLTTAEENRLISEENTGIDAKDRIFNKMKKEKGWKAAKKAFVSGVFIGATMSEVFGLIQGHTGIVEDIANDIKGGGGLPPGVDVEHLTMITYLKHLIEGDVPKMDMGNLHEVLVGENHIKLPEGVDMIQNADGSYNLIGGEGKILVENLTMAPGGALTEEAKNILAQNGITIENHLIDGTTQQSVSPEDYAKNHSSEMKTILKRIHLDNNTPDESNLNELKTQFGGINGSGIDANGNIVLTVGSMTPDGSFHQELSANAQELMQAGQLKMLFSMSDGTQNHVFEFTVTPKGEIIIPPGETAGKLLFSNIDGRANFNGRFGEVAQDMGNGQYQILSTIEGKGVEDIVDTIRNHTEETILTVPGSYEGDLLFVPVVAGNPLEKFTKEEQDKKAEIKIDKNEKIDDEKVKEKEDKKAEIKIDKNEKIDDEKVIVYEISKEEYGGMNDDIKMLNRKIQRSEGIITIEETDFKSEYGKKRYLELKHIGKGVPVTFNKEETKILGYEMEKILMQSKIILKNPDSKVLNEEMRADLEMLNETIQKSRAPVTIQESDFKSEYGKKRYLEIKGELGDRSTSFNKDGVEKIATELEKILVGPRKIEGINTETDSEKNKNIEKETSATKREEKIFTAKDLSRVGTEFISTKGVSYKIIRVKKGGGIFNLFNKTKIEVVYKNEKGEEKFVSYKKKDLERALEQKNIKITKIEEGK